jgi:hypothetical protein
MSSLKSPVLSLEYSLRIGFADVQATVLPLPKGEGRGEGEPGARSGLDGFGIGSF